VILDDEAGVRFLDGPRRREAAGHQRQTKINHTLATPNNHAPAANSCGYLRYTALSYIAHDAGGKSVGCFPDAERAARKLRAVAARHST
jgi:hypothetical protein